MHDIGIVKILQSFDGICELQGAQLVTKEYTIETYELEVISSFTTNVLHNVAISHPFRDHREPPILEGVGDPDEVEDV